MRSQVFQWCVGLIYLPFSSLPPEVPSSTTFWGMHLANHCLYRFSRSHCDIHRYSSLRHQKSKNVHLSSRVSVNGCKSAINLWVWFSEQLTQKDLENKGTCSLHLLSSQGSEQHQITLLLLNLKHYTSKLSLHVSFLKNNVSSEEFKSESNSYICAPYSLQQH